MNWRKCVIDLLLRATGNAIPRYVEEIARVDALTPAELEAYHGAKLEKLLFLAHRDVPYYRDILEESGVVRGGKVRLDRFEHVPPLTRETLGRERKRLLSTRRVERKCFENSSGGSTGEPVRFVQDAEYRRWNMADKIYRKSIGGQEIGDVELRLWGSERDLLDGRETLATRWRNFLYNRKELNAFRMSRENMGRYVAFWNAYRPAWVDAYVDAIDILGAYIREEELSIHSPRGIAVTAGTLYPRIRAAVEEVFRCTVYNRYGSREAGDMAYSCGADARLHVSPWNHHLEILDERMRPVGPGESGRVHVTTLNNHSMPLIRYDTGDIAVAAVDPVCSCGRSASLIEKIEGREMSLFRTREGKRIPGEFFIHFIGVVFNEGAIRKYQVIQEDYDRVRIRVVVADGDAFASVTGKIESAIRRVMGDDCRVVWDHVEDIEPSPSGKYMYTICELGAS